MGGEVVYFDINDYKGRYVMHCTTEEESKDFCNYLHKVGRKWDDNTSYLGDTYYRYHEARTVYYFNTGTLGDMYFATLNNYTILEWSDFMNKEFTKADLKTGDVVLYRNGETGIVNCSFNMIINKEGYNNFSDYSNDLTVATKWASNWDIIAVRRPRISSNCQFTAFEYKWGDLVYDRKEVKVEEMTLEEVCKALGKEIKIIKG